MATYGRKMGYKLASNLMRTLRTPSTSNFASNSRPLTTTAATATATATATSSFVSSEVITSHTAKWMQDTSKKSPMELINEVPPIKVEARIVACEGDSNPALGHPIEFICLDKDEPAICKYCGLRYVQDHGHHHH